RTMPRSLAWVSATPSDIDLTTDGLRLYRVNLPSEVNRTTTLFVVVIRNGPGPAVLVAGGTHGDEFEGQIAVADVVRKTDLRTISGLIIALPLHNYPACLAGTRDGPFDNTDLNRLFKAGMRHDGETAAIAD